MTTIHLFIGQPIEYGSERALLQEVFRYLAAQGKKAVVLANFNLHGRQIDLVVALEDGLVLFEAKGNHTALRGTDNGNWQMQVAGGRWKDMANPYSQALANKNVLRDDASAFSGENIDYPSAAVVFVPGIPASSNIFLGDYKVAIVGLADVPTILGKTKAKSLSLDNWQAFAAKAGLTAISSVEVAVDPALAEAEALIAGYLDRFRSTYQPTAAQLMPFRGITEGAVRTTDEVVQSTADGGSLLIEGKSGCGKSMLAVDIALRSLNDRVPIILPSREFEGNFREVLSRETALLDAPAGEALILACRKLGRPLLFVVDGYNECSPRNRAKLTRAIAAAAKRYEAQIVVTAQEPLERDDLLPLPKFSVVPPDDVAKLAIAEIETGSGAFPSCLHELLASVSTGLEASLLGRVAQSVRPDASRFAIFDEYARRRLGDAASDGIRALARIAGTLFDKLSFSITERDLDRLFDREGVQARLFGDLRSANILSKHGDRVSFSHELFLDAFASEAIVRRSGVSAEAVLSAIAEPRHASRKALIVGAIDSDQLLAEVLNGLADSQTISACLAGHCGARARTWATSRAAAVLARVQEEAAGFQCVIDKKAWMEVEIIGEVSWTAQERAFLPAIGEQTADAFFLDGILDVLRLADERSAAEQVRLREVAREQKVALRSGIFANLYVRRAPLGVSMLINDIINYRFFRRGEQSAKSGEPALARIARSGLSLGQVYFLLRLARERLYSQPNAAAVVIDLLEDLWAKAPYHLKLDLLDSIHACGHADEEIRRMAIDAVEKLPNNEHLFLNSSIIDALHALGALQSDEDSHVDTVRNELALILSEKPQAGAAGDPFQLTLTKAEVDDLAHSVWFRQFDHPYSGAYYRVLEELGPADKKRLLLRAAAGAGEYASFNAILMEQLADFGGPDVVQAIAHWLALPRTNSSMPQQAIEDFVIAHIAIARLGGEPPAASGHEASQAAENLRAVGRILYWINRHDLGAGARRSHCAPDLAYLAGAGNSSAAAVLHELTRAHVKGNFFPPAGVPTAEVSLSGWFPQETLAIARRCLRSASDQTGYFNYLNREDLLRFAIGCLGRDGDQSDLEFLRLLAQDAQLGRDAIDAIRAVEARSVSPA